MIVAICHCKSHPRLYRKEGLLVTVQDPNDVYFVDPSCADSSWAQVPNRSIDYMFGIHCPIYESLRDHELRSPLQDILHEARPKHNQNGCVYFQLYDGAKVQNVEALQDLVNGFTSSGKKRKFWAVTIEKPPFYIGKSVQFQELFLCFKRTDA